MYVRLGQEVSEALGDKIDEPFLCTLMGGDWREYEHRVAAYKGEAFPIDEYMRILFERINYTIENEAIPLRPGAKEVLDFCKENGYPMAIATSTHKKQAYQCLHNTGLYEYFDYIVTGDQVTNGKPDPEIYQKVLKHFNVKPEQAIVLEDGHNGSQAALKAGCNLVVVEDLAQLTDEDRQRAILHTFKLIDVIELLRSDNETTAGL